MRGCCLDVPLIGSYCDWCVCEFDCVFDICISCKMHTTHTVTISHCVLTRPTSPLYLSIQHPLRGHIESFVSEAQPLFCCFVQHSIHWSLLAHHDEWVSCHVSKNESNSNWCPFTVTGHRWIELVCVCVYVVWRAMCVRLDSNSGREMWQRKNSINFKSKRNETWQNLKINIMQSMIPLHTGVPAWMRIAKWRVATNAIAHAGRPSQFRMHDDDFSLPPPFSSMLHASKRIAHSRLANLRTNVGCV